MMTFKASALLLIGLVATSAQAGDNYFVNQRKEASMLVTGVVNLNPDGSVHDYTLDHPEKLDAPVTDIVKQNAVRWKFQFAAAPSGVTSEKMTLRLVAQMLDDQHATLRLAGSSFDDIKDSDDGENLQYKERSRIDYPKEAIKENVWGTVYVLIRVGPDGSVLDASPEQINLGRFAPSADMKRYRSILADAALKGVKQWRFTLPTKGKLAQSPEWLVRVPVVFVPVGQLPSDDYGQWKVYVPGPRMSIPWLHEPQLVDDAPDALSNGGLHTLSHQPRLSPQSSGS